MSETSAAGAATDPRRPTVTITPEFKADSLRQLAELRAQKPVHRMKLPSGLEAWLVVSAQEARQALTHEHLRKDPTPAGAALAAVGFTAHKPGVGLGGNMLDSDPPAHGRLRRLAASAFSPRRTAALAPRIEQIADDLLDAMAPLGQVDLVEAFTAPLPMTVICELLGVPEQERHDFRKWSRAALGVPSPEQQAGATNLNDYLRVLVETKRRTPEDDLLTAFVEIQGAEDGRLSEQELVGTAVLLVVAGHDTTVNLLGNAMLALFDRPDQAEILRSRPELTSAAVEEFLRFDSSVEFSTLRFAAQDMHLGGQDIARGDVVMVALGSASRDLTQSSGGDAASLDVTREAARHLAFGHGIHHCLGAPLARLEATIALNRLLARFPDLQLAVPHEEVAWAAGIMRGPRSLPVRFSAELPGQLAPQLSVAGVADPGGAAS